MVVERNWRWVDGDGFTELCNRANCEATDATHYHRPQDAKSRDSDGFTPETGTDSHGLSTGTVSEDIPLDQPMPRQEGGEPVTPEARRVFLEMLVQREAKGIATYGRSLHSQNGRDPLQDALEEQIDGWQYLVQAQMERAVLMRALEQARDQVQSLSVAALAVEWDPETEPPQCSWCLGVQDSVHDDGCPVKVLADMAREAT